MIPQTHLDILHLSNLLSRDGMAADIEKWDELEDGIYYTTVTHSFRVLAGSITRGKVCDDT